MIRAIAVAGFSLLVWSSSAIGQDRHVHDGFWIGFGLGIGMNVTEELDNDRLIGGAGYLRLGGTPSQRVLLGGEAVGWARGQSNEVVSRGNGMFVAMFFPSENGGFFLKGGIGGAWVSRVVVSGTTTVEVRANGGLGTTAGVGYDVRLARNLYLTPNVDWILQVFDQDPLFGSAASTNSIVIFTLGLTWH
jgi:hypothetical protein